MNVRPELTVYSRPGCHLCEEFIEALLATCGRRAAVTVHNVDDDPAWNSAYGLRIPVLCHGGRELCATVLDVAIVRALLD